MTASPDLHPTAEELTFLNLSYNRFLDLYEEIISDNFWRRRPAHRLSKVKDICAIYMELMKYPPFGYIFDTATRPNYKLVGHNLAKFLRNILLHFPFFEKWTDISFNKSLITSFEKKGSIDSFLSRTHPADIKYRFWGEDKKRMTYIEINLQLDYASNKAVFLNEIIKEKDGVKFLCIFMKDILMTQVEYVKKLK